jgi:ABC-type uncharacterized transport system involved in gliding motility auxiliary subunit
VRRRARAASFSAAVIAVVLGLLVAANVLASKSEQSWDLTRAGNNTLAPQSVLVAKRLNADLEVVGLFHPGVGNGQPEAEALVALYEAQSPHLKYRTADPDKDPVDVKRYGITQVNTLVLAYKGKTELLLQASQSEVDFTSALIKLEADRVPMVCWGVGDGERDLLDSNQSTGYSGVAALLEKNNFVHQELLLASTTLIPAECDELVILDPTKPLPATTVKAVENYLAAGGRMLIAAEPWALDPKATASLNAVLNPYGLGFSGALVVEGDTSRSAAQDPTIPAVIDYGQSPITGDIQRIVSFFPRTTAITGTPAPGAKVVRIATSSNSAYGIPAIRSNLARQSGDVSGPFTMMETVEQVASAGGSGNSDKTRIVIVGTQSFAENRTLPPNNNDANLELALGSFQWLAGQDALIALPPKPDRSLPLSLTQDQQSTLIFITVVLMPGLIVLAGVVVWWRRRVFV